MRVVEVKRALFGASRARSASVGSGRSWLVARPESAKRESVRVDGRVEEDAFDFARCREREVRRCVSPVNEAGQLLRAMAACYSEQASSTSGNVTKKSSAAAGKPVCWQQRLFGKQLSRCNQVNQQDTKPCDASGSLVDEDGRPTCGVIGVYFSFINPGATCDDFTRQLLELYANVNSPRAENDRDAENPGRQRERRKKFEVVHVVLWSNVADVLDFEESFRAHVCELPWLAVPNLDYERKVRYIRVFLFRPSYASVNNEVNIKYAIAK